MVQLTAETVIKISLRLLITRMLWVANALSIVYTSTIGDVGLYRFSRSVCEHWISIKRKHCFPLP